MMNQKRLVPGAAGALAGCYKSFLSTICPTQYYVTYYMMVMVTHVLDVNVSETSSVATDVNIMIRKYQNVLSTYKGISLSA